MEKEKDSPNRMGVGRIISRIVVPVCVVLTTAFEAWTQPVCIFVLGFAMFLCMLGVVLYGGLIVSAWLIPWLEDYSAILDNDTVTAMAELKDRLEHLKHQQWGTAPVAISLLYFACAVGWSDGWAGFAGWIAVIYLALAVSISVWHRCTRDKTDPAN